MTLRLPRRPLALAACLACALSACNETATQLEGTDEEPTLGELTLLPLVVTALAVGQTPGIDVTYTYAHMTAFVQVKNPNGPELGHLEVTVAYAFSEVSDSIELVAPGVYRFADPILVHPAESGVITLTVAPGDSASVEVDLGTPRPLTMMSFARDYFLTGTEVRTVRTVGNESLSAAAETIRTLSNERVESRLAGFGHLGIVYSGIVLPALVPGEIRVVGAELEETTTVAAGRETVRTFVKDPGATARIEFDVRNQAPFTVPAGVPYRISYDSPTPNILDGETIWPQITLLSGTTAEAIGPGDTLTIDTGLDSEFSEDPANLPEYVLLVDTESVARVYPIILDGAGVRAWLNVRDREAAVSHR